jgi:hypothetical protein
MSGTTWTSSLNLSARLMQVPVRTRRPWAPLVKVDPRDVNNGAKRTECGIERLVLLHEYDYYDWVDSLATQTPNQYNWGVIP